MAPQITFLAQELQKKSSGRWLQLQYGTFSPKHCQFSLYWLHFCFYPPQIWNKQPFTRSLCFLWKVFQNLNMNFFPTPIKVLIQKNMFTLLQDGMLWVTWVLSGVQNKVGLWIKFSFAEFMKGISISNKKADTIIEVINCVCLDTFSKILGRQW